MSKYKRSGENEYIKNKNRRKDKVNKATRKKKFVISMLGALVVTTLVSCGSVKESVNMEEDIEFAEKQIEENADDEFSQEETSLNDIFSKMGSQKLEEHIEKFNEQMHSNENWNPLFENRCFYMKGIKAYMPTTPREYQELFDTEFVTAWIYSGDSSSDVKYIIFEDKNENKCTLGVFGDDLEFPQNSEELLEFSMDKPVVCISPQEYESDFFTKYEVTFEDVDTYINPYGYIYIITGEKTVGIRYIPEEIMAYYYYINNNFPVELQDETYISFDEMYGDTNELQYTIEDVTCDGIPELFFLSDMYVDGYTYDKENKKLVRFDKQYAEGTLYLNNLFIRKTRDEIEGTEYFEYNLYHSNGELEVLATQRIAKNEETKKLEYYVNGLLTTKEEYDLVAERYHMPRYIKTENFFSEYKEEELIESLSTNASLFYSLIENRIDEEKGSECFQPYEK